MAARKNVRFSTRQIGQMALAGLALLLLLTLTLVIVRNRVENDIVQHSALDLPLLKNRWPQFREAVTELHSPIAATLAKPEPLVISSPLPEKMREITDAHTRNLVGTDGYNGRIIANIEVIYFERDSVRPVTWYWSPIVNTSLTATEIHTRLSWQQLTETDIITAEGPVTGPITPTTLTNQRHAMLLFYIYSEWTQGQTLITILIRGSQAIALLTVLLISYWVFAHTRKLRFTLLVILMSIIGLAVYGSLTLRALSLHTVLSMLITLQFGPDANKAVDFAGLSLIAGAAYSLLFLGLLHLPTLPACPDCSRNVSDNYRFCPYCNFVLKRKCSRCAAAVDTRWNYCPSCSEDI